MELVMEADWNEDSAAMKQVQIRSEWQGSFDYAVALASRAGNCFPQDDNSLTFFKFPGSLA